MEHLERPNDFAVVRAVLARQRQLGASFDEAWPLAVGALPPPTGRRTRYANDRDRDRTLSALSGNG